jgi:hypothetical protein
MRRFLTSTFVLSYRNVVLIIVVFLIVIFFFATIPPFNYWTFSKTNLDSRLFADYGQFISGFLGSFISLLGFILLYKTLTAQREQFTQSSFQSNFYSLLENHRNILNSISDKVDGISVEDEKGADFFADLAQRVCIDYSGIGETMFGIVVAPECNPESKGVERLIQIYNYHYHIYQSDLGHYFRSLYHFVTFIIESDVDEGTKTRHMKVLRAQLSNYEILLLAYNCLHEYGEEFKPLVEKYELLKNLNFEQNLDSRYSKRIIDIDVLTSQYPHLKTIYHEKQG